MQKNKKQMLRILALKPILIIITKEVFMATHILILLANGVEEIELITPTDLWRRAGYSVTIASIDSNLPVRGKQGIVISADTTLDTIDDSKFNYLYIPGGASEVAFRNSSQAMKLIEKFIDQQKTVITICAATLLLSPWLTDKKATCYPPLKDLLPNWIDQEVVVDLPFITSQGVGTAHLLAFHVIQMISGIPATEELKNATVFK